MTREKRKMVRILDPELFEKNKTALLRLERQRVETMGGDKRFLSDSRVLDTMARTCSALWGAGGDLYIASQKKTHAMVNKLAGDLVDENISELVKALAIWSGLEISYQREGSTLTFRFQEPSGALRELRIPMRQPEQPDQRSVH